jgi:hypothetical protein
MDTNHPLGYGMPQWYSGYFARSSAFSLGQKKEKDGADKEGREKDKNNGAAGEADREPAKRFPATVVSRFSDTVLLESGWIRGADVIADQPAIVEIQYGKGYIELIGISVQRRGQPHGTFRILFNAIQRSTITARSTKTKIDNEK